MSNVGTSGDTAGPPKGTSYPGERLGLPAFGPRSLAGWGRRVLALIVDWFVSLMATIAVLGFDRWSNDDVAGWVTLGIFFVEVSFFTTLLGGSFGQLVMRIAVVRLDGRPLNLLAVLLRTLLIVLVVPPLVFNRDQRGLHDLATGTVTLRR